MTFYGANEEICTGTYFIFIYLWLQRFFYIMYAVCTLYKLVELNIEHNKIITTAYVKIYQIKFT